MNFKVKPNFIAFLICLCAFIAWVVILQEKYYHFGYCDWDLAFFSQASFNLIHGSQYNTLAGMNYFGNHSYFITFLYLPIFFIFQHPLTLMTIELAAYVVSAYLLFRVFYRNLSVVVSLGLMSAYLLLPANIFTLMYDFNTEPLAAPFIVLIFDSFRQQRWRLFWVSAVALLFIKENLALVTMMFGVYGLIFGKDRAQKKMSVLLIVISLVVFYVLAIIFVPYFRHVQDHPFVVRYAYLGGSIGEILHTMLVNPGTILSHLFNVENKIYLCNLFGPWLLLSLFGWPILLIVLPILLQHLLSTHPPEHSLFYYYGMTMTPFIFLAVYHGLCNFRKKIHPTILNVTVIFLLVMTILNLKSYEKTFWNKLDYHADSLTSERWRMVKKIPSGVGVVASFDFLAELSLRREIYPFHKIYDDLYQDHKMISSSVLNERRSFTLPDSIRYMLIDLNDPWLRGSMLRNPKAVKTRIDEFLKEWRLQEESGSIKLYVR